MVNKIKSSIEKFALDLNNKKVLTEAASGNYVITPIIAAICGADVVAFTKDSNYATIDEVKNQTYALAENFGVEDKITIVTDKNDINYSEIDIVTNTGFVRPIDKDMIKKLPSSCVIPLMWEPWEYRRKDLDLEACVKKGIKVYGTNENNNKLKTMSYIGYIVLNFLLNEKLSPFSGKILILGNKHFVLPIIEIMKINGYIYEYNFDYETSIDLKKYNAIVIAEHENNKLLIGKDGYIKDIDISEDAFLIHICGNVDFRNVKCKTNIKEPASFGYMSYTTDYIDNQAVIDLHTAGLKVAEGMLEVNQMEIAEKEYKSYMENNYPALAFEDKRFW